ncbi:MAG TPA: hypothetical protein DCE41_16930 [Cytophagales bacterium]|nr:hypothetical protein [Cytophagales bacterium]HAP60911.1 hypothetical protein [Cytophagales bacterium]
MQGQTTTVYIDAVYNYLWRDYDNGTYSIQPNIEFEGKDPRFSFVFWASAYLVPGENNFLEAFFQGSYALVQREAVTLSLGAAYYPAFHSDTSSFLRGELLEATLFCDFPTVPLQPSLEFYYNWDVGLYQRATLSHSFTLGKNYSLDLSAYASFRIGNTVEDMLGGGLAGKDGTLDEDAYDGWRDAGLQVSLPFEVAGLSMGLSGGIRYMAGWTPDANRWRPAGSLTFNFP